MSDEQTNAAPQVRGNEEEMPHPAASTSPAVAAPHPVVAEMVAAKAFVQSMVDKRDAWDGGYPLWDGGYLWYGWALEEAFHAGAKYAREVMPTANVFITQEMLAFLHGIGPMDGVHFGYVHPELPGRYWWRKFLPPIPAAADRTDDKEGGP